MCENKTAILGLKKQHTSSITRDTFVLTVNGKYSDLIREGSGPQSLRLPTVSTAVT